MDWLRRNWPDLLIGLALIAVIAGIVATLLTGGSFFPLGGDGTTAGPSTSPPAASAPAVTDDDAESEADDGPSVAVLPPSGDAGETLPPGAPEPGLDEDDEAAPAAADQPAEPATPDAASEDAPSVTPIDPGAASADEPAPQADEPAAVAAPADTPAATPAPGAGDLPTEPYRVSVGAFGLRENAEAQAERFRGDGYPVFLGTQGELTLVLVGPYDDAARARQVADEIRGGGYGVEPVIYEFRPEGDAAAATPQAPAPATPQAATPEASSEPGGAAPAAEASGTTLQVGAYADRASATPQIERLEGLGFEVGTLDEGGLVKLTVGPFSGAALEDARVILNGAGIEHFAR